MYHFLAVNLSIIAFILNCMRTAIMQTHTLEIVIWKKPKSYSRTNRFLHLGSWIIQGEKSHGFKTRVWTHENKHLKYAKMKLNNLVFIPGRSNYIGSFVYSFLILAAFFDTGFGLFYIYLTNKRLYIWLISVCLDLFYINLINEGYIVQFYL